MPKGAIPARMDAETTRYDAYQRWSLASFKSAKIYPSFGAAMPQIYVRTLEPALEAMVDSGNVRTTGLALGHRDDTLGAVVHARLVPGLTSHVPGPTTSGSDDPDLERRFLARHQVDHEAEGLEPRHVVEEPLGRERPQRP